MMKHLFPGLVLVALAWPAEARQDSPDIVSVRGSLAASTCWTDANGTTACLVDVRQYFTPGSTEVGTSRENSYGLGLGSFLSYAGGATFTGRAAARNGSDRFFSVGNSTVEVVVDVPLDETLVVAGFLRAPLAATGALGQIQVFACDQDGCEATPEVRIDNQATRQSAFKIALTGGRRYTISAALLSTTDPRNLPTQDLRFTVILGGVASPVFPPSVPPAAQNRSFATLSFFSA